MLSFSVGSVSFPFIGALRIKSRLIVGISVSLHHATELMTPRHRFATAA